MERWANGAETEQAGANTVWLMPRHSCKLASTRLALWELSFPSPFFPSPPLHQPPTSIRNISGVAFYPQCPRQFSSTLYIDKSSFSEAHVCKVTLLT